MRFQSYHNVDMLSIGVFGGLFIPSNVCKDR